VPNREGGADPKLGEDILGLAEEVEEALEWEIAEG